MCISLDMLSNVTRLALVMVGRCLTASPFSAMDPFLSLLDVNGNLASMPDRREIFKSRLGTYYTAQVLLGVPAGYCNRYIGPRLTVALALLLQAVALSLLFISPFEETITAAGILGAASNQLGLSATSGVGVLFPGKGPSIVTLLAVTADLSMMLPLLFLNLAEGLGTPTVYQVWMGAILVAGLLFALSMPKVAFEPPVALNDKSMLLPDETGSAHTQEIIRVSTLDQVLTVPYAGLLVYFISSFIRNRKFFAPNMRDVFQSVVGASRGAILADRLNLANGLAFIPAVLLGFIAQKSGISTVFWLHSVMGILLLALPLGPPDLLMVAEPVAWGFCCYHLSLVGLYVSDQFGFENYGVLTGVAGLASGVFGVVYDLRWTSFFHGYLAGSYVKALHLLLINAFAVLIIPLGMSLSKKASYKSGEVRYSESL